MNAVLNTQAKFSHALDQAWFHIRDWQRNERHWLRRWIQRWLQRVRP
jgi:hypothetical protein